MQPKWRPIVPVLYQTSSTPFFSKYDLRPDIGGKSSLSRTSKLLSDIVALADGSNDLIEIGRLVNEPIDLINKLAIILSEKGLIKFL